MFRLLLAFVKQRTGTLPSRLDLTQLDAPTIGAFLEHLEHERSNTARTRNIRLAAIHSFFQYCALRHPEHAALIQRVLAIPHKRAEKRIVTFLTPDEVRALLESPNRATWAGRRDHALLLNGVLTGLRVSELLGLTHADTQLRTGAHVRTIGIGRKERVAPLTSQTVSVLRVWIGNATAIRRARCFRHATAARSPATRSNIGWPSTCRQPSERTRRCGPGDHDARAPAHRRDDVAKRRDRHLHDCPVVGPRAGTNDARLPPR